MKTRTRRLFGRFAFLVFSAAIGLPVFAQADWSARVLAERDLAKKEEMVCVQSIEGVPIKTLSRLISREPHGPAVASAAGQYLEKAQLDQSTPGLIRQIANRPDIGAQVLAYAAVSPRAADLIVGFSSSKSRADQQIAARLIAATAVMRTAEDREQMQPPEKVVGRDHDRLNVDYKAEIEALLGRTKDEIAIEYLLFAAGVDRIALEQKTLQRYAKSKEPAIAMAAQFASAVAERGVDESAVLQAIALEPKRGQARRALSYDPRHTPRVYAVMAAGEARLSGAIDPLMQLIESADLHTAVHAARALGEIGGEGVSVRLVEAMGDDTLWPVRVAMYDAAGRHPDKAAVALLRQRYDEETGRLRQDALYALLSIVAGKPEGLTIQAFDEWWRLNEASFEVDAPGTRAWRLATKVGAVQVQAVAGFYESAVISDRPVFAVDASVSMEGGQIESLKQTLNDVVTSFPPRVMFNIVDFGGHVRTLASGGLIPAANRIEAMRQFTYDLELTFGTRTYDAIERAMNVPGLDTVHFLSDGAPYGSHLENWRRIDYVTRLYCSTAPIAVHVLYFPNAGQRLNDNPGGLQDLMRRYAAANAGNYGVVEALPGVDP